MTERQKLNPPKKQPLVTTVPSEQAVIDVLTRHGIPAITGKALGIRWCDVVCFGCIGVEVKHAYLRGKMFTFVFTPSQQKRLKADFIVLVCDYETHQTYHVFDVKDEVFYKNGKLKIGICYIPRQHRQKSRFPILTVDKMEASKDDWGKIEQLLKQRQIQLIETGKNLPDWA